MIHTNKDVPANLDVTKLGRVAYMTAGIAWTLAALPDAEAGRLPALERAAIEQRRATARHTALATGGSADDVRLADREAIAVGQGELASVAAMWPGTAAEVRTLRGGLAGALSPSRRPQDLRVPERLAAVRGPLEVYHYDHLAAVLGATAPSALQQRDDVLAYEALNLVDGKRSIGEIRDVLTGRYVPVPAAEVAARFERLVQAGVVRLRAR